MERQVLTRRKANIVRLLLPCVPVIAIGETVIAIGILNSSPIYVIIRKTNTKRKGDCYEEKDTRTLPNYFP